MVRNWDNLWQGLYIHWTFDDTIDTDCPVSSVRMTQSFLQLEPGFLEPDSLELQSLELEPLD